MKVGCKGLGMIILENNLVVVMLVYWLDLVVGYDADCATN